VRELTLFPGQPMRIYRVPPVVLENPDKWCVQVKKNGHRAIVRCPAVGKVNIFSRHGDLLTAAGRAANGWCWLCDIFDSPFVLDGELLGPRQAGSSGLTLCVWDAILLGGASLLNVPYLERWGLLGETVLQGNLDNNIFHNSGGSPMLVCAETMPVEAWDGLWRGITDPDGPDEGLVLKRKDMPLAWHPRPGVEDPNQLKLRRKG